MSFSRKSEQVHVHAEGLIEVCDLPMFRGTPHELTALRRSLGCLTQVKRTPEGLPVAQVIKGVLFVEFNLGDVDPAVLPRIAEYVRHRVEQKAKQALLRQRPVRVK